MEEHDAVSSSEEVEIDSARAATDADADQLASYAHKKWGPEGSNFRKLSPDFLEGWD